MVHAAFRPRQCWDSGPLPSTKGSTLTTSKCQRSSSVQILPLSCTMMKIASLFVLASVVNAANINICVKTKLAGVESVVAGASVQVRAMKPSRYDSSFPFSHPHCLLRHALLCWDEDLDDVDVMTSIFT